jgi:hypothetical protein
VTALSIVSAGGAKIAPPAFWLMSLHEPVGRARPTPSGPRPALTSAR